QSFARGGVEGAGCASSNAHVRLDRPQQDRECIGFVIVDRIEPACAYRRDDRRLIGIALAGDVALDGADGDALVSDRALLAPRRAQARLTASKTSDRNAPRRLASAQTEGQNQASNAGSQLDMGEPGTTQ